jgi:hypothetical protein
MSRLIELSISGKADSSKTWIFAEDLSRELQASGLGVLPMAEADAVKDLLQIREIKARKLKRCSEIVDVLIDRHYMREHVTVRHCRAPHKGSLIPDARLHFAHAGPTGNRFD